MTFVPRRPVRRLGDDLLDSLGLDSGASDSSPSVIPLANTDIGTFLAPTPGYVYPTIVPTGTTMNPITGQVTVTAPSTAQTVQGIASTATGLTNIFSSISNLFSSKPATVTPVSVGGVRAGVTTTPATIAGMSTGTLLLLGLIGAAAVVLTAKRKRA